MRELAPGLWWWEARHPEWEPEDAETEDWGPEVSSYAVDDGTRLLLIDPTMPPDPVTELARAREVVILLTCPWHQRDTARLVPRLGATVLAPPPDPGETDALAAHHFRAGERLPIGVQVFAGMEPNDLVLWLQRPRALAVGDTLIDRGRGLEFPTEWANKGVAPEEIRASLAPVLELPVDHVLLTHGPPADRAALHQALS